MTDTNLAQIEKYYDDYGCRVRELHEQGRKVIGYLCAFTPVEIITAAGFIPFRIKGDVREPITRADTQMETIICPVVRSAYDVTLKGRYDFLDGLIIPHACDSINRTYDIWKYSLDAPYSHLVNLPHSIDDSSLEFYKNELNTFRKSLGNYAGKEITDTDLTRAVELHNRVRTLIKELYELRKSDPPLLTGSEMTKILVAVMGIPPEESIELLSGVIEEIENRKDTPIKQSYRIMVVGAEVDDTALIDVIEGSGASVVTDDLCPGTREYFPMTEVTAEVIDGIAERYLRGIKCGRTYREVKGTYGESLDDRFGHITRAVDEYGVDGVILYIYMYCDPYGFEVPAMKDYIESNGTPVLYIEDEYSQSTISRLRTRVQAFLEMMG
ncbi:MAG: 2-hydroxyacyl-CoA dehydratase [Dehalococcoidales bacterium]|nr:MAG: 2-hydroxyacyl-CoA dehydratase [Dehalococcoidales bacterium]